MQENSINYSTSNQQDLKSTTRQYECRPNATNLSKTSETNILPNDKNSLSSEIEATGSSHVNHRLNPHQTPSYQHYHQQSSLPQMDNEHDQYP